MNRERRVGRRSVVQSQIQKSIKLTPEDEQQFSKGLRKSLFNDDASFVMRRSTLKPLHEINNFQFSSSKSKSHEKLYEETTYAIPSFMETFSKHKIPLSPPSKSKFLESSMVKKHKELNEPVLQSKDLFNSLIDSPCTKYEKVQFNNALSSASKYLLNRHLESVSQNADIFKEAEPQLNLNVVNKNNINERETILKPCFKDFNSTITEQQEVFQTDCQTQTSNISLFATRNLNLNAVNKININECETIVKPCLKDFNSTITEQHESYQTDCQTQTSNISLSAENIEELKKNQIEDIRQMKLKFCNLIKTRFQEIELEIEKQFSIQENKIAENYDTLLSKIQYGNNDSTESPELNTSIETVKEKNYSRMTGTFGILNNMKQDCSFLKTPKTKGKTREQMLNQGILTPHTMSFVLQEQLMDLNRSS